MLYKMLHNYNYNCRHAAVAQHVTVNATVVSSIPNRGNEIFSSIK